MPTIDKAFEADNGISIEGKAHIYYTAVDPTISGFAAPIGSLLLDTITGATWRKIGANNLNWTKFGVNQFGLVVLFEKSYAITTTTSTTFQTKLSLVTPVLELGTYRIGWNSLVGNTENNKESEYRITNNGIEIESMHIQTVKLEFDQVFTGFSFEVISGTNTFELQQRIITGVSRMQQASLEFWKAL